MLQVMINKEVVHQDQKQLYTHHHHHATIIIC